MRMGIFITSAIICMIKGDFLATPPRPMRPYIYPFAKMKVGDSFAVEGAVELRRIRAAACYHGIRHPPIKFSIRIDDPSANPKTYRCWRVS